MKVSFADAAAIGTDHPCYVIERALRKRQDSNYAFGNEMRAEFDTTTMPSSVITSVEERLRRFEWAINDLYMSLFCRMRKVVEQVVARSHASLEPQLGEKLQQSEFELAENIPIPEPLADEIKDLHSPNGPPRLESFNSKALVIGNYSRRYCNSHTPNS